MLVERYYVYNSKHWNNWYLKWFLKLLNFKIFTFTDYTIRTTTIWKVRMIYESRKSLYILKSLKILNFERLK